MKKIFIASSGASLPVARAIGEVLKSVPDVEPMVWDKSFKPGDIVLEKIEQIANSVDGVVIVASPDDKTQKKGGECLTVRDNVIFEYGYFESALGRNRVAIALFDKAELPTDLGGLTVVKMGPLDLRNPAVPPRRAAMLRDWVQGLPLVQAGISPIIKAHGLSGIWAHRGVYRKWRNIILKDDESVFFHGDLSLHLDPSGKHGAGSIYGRLDVKLEEAEAEFEIHEIVTSACVDCNGVLSLRIKSHCRQRTKLKGKPRQRDGFEQELAVAAYLDYVFQPTRKPHEMSGAFEARHDGKVRSKGKIEITKHVSY